jgi:integrase
MACVRKRRGKWIIDYYDQFGRRHWETVGTNKKEAEEKLAEKTIEIRKGSYNPASAKITVNEYAKSWLGTYAQVNNLKASTVKSYGQCLSKYILPALGGLQLRSVRRDPIKSFVGDLGKAGLSRNSVRIVHATLRTMLNSAVEDEILGVNYALKIGKFTKGKAERQQHISPFTREEVAVFLDAVQAYFPTYHPFVLTLARTGMRLGEALALQWGDVDFEGRFIEVRRNLVSGRIETPKSGKTRRVDMSLQLAGAIQEHLRRRKEETLRKGWSEIPDWVFCDSNGHPLDGNNFRKRVFVKALAKAGLRRIRIHDLRHTYASLLIQNDESLAYVRDQLGHHSIQVTVDIYGHLVPGGNKRAVDRLDDVSWGSRSSKMVANGNLAQTADQLGQQAVESSKEIGATRRSRTGDLLITNQLLYQLS